MGKSTLGRVLDPGALDACARPRARLSVEVPFVWLVEGADLIVTAPTRLACARCDGGGCDACDRTGALRGPAEACDRSVRVRLPSAPRMRTADEPWAIAVRIPDPFGAEHGIAQLVLEVRASERPSACVVRIASPAIRDEVMAEVGGSSGAPFGMNGLPVVAAAVIVAVLFAIFGR